MNAQEVFLELHVVFRVLFECVRYLLRAVIVYTDLPSYIVRVCEMILGGVIGN